MKGEEGITIKKVARKRLSKMMRRNQPCIWEAVGMPTRGNCKCTASKIGMNLTSQGGRKKTMWLEHDKQEVNRVLITWVFSGQAEDFAIHSNCKRKPLACCKGDGMIRYMCSKRSLWLLCEKWT